MRKASEASYRKFFLSARLSRGDSRQRRRIYFDCRCLHNPGRYDEYKMLTGRDEPVQRFLEEKGEIQPFLQNVFALTDRAVEKYLKRGFTDLSVGFGCTGGQHRSVYSAEHLARHIKEKFPQVVVSLCHREQNIHEEL